MPEKKVKKERAATKEQSVVQKRISVQNYEDMYYSLWEMAQRYQKFCQFRVIGKSYDDRMIPMIEIGTGSDVIFCVSGMEGTCHLIPRLLVQMAEEYCRSYESGWQLEDFYEVRKLLDQIRICMIPLVNPDGFEISRNGFGVIRNPIFRQMLRMQSILPADFGYNARGVDIEHNFPTVHFIRSRMGEEPGSENETKAVIRIIQEYGGRGLLTFGQAGREIIYFHSEQGAGSLPKSYRLARYMQKTSSYHLGREKVADSDRKKFKGMGTLEQFYIQTVKQPAFRIKTPALEQKTKCGENYKDSEECDSQIYEEIHLLPLEYIFSLVNGNICLRKILSE